MPLPFLQLRLVYRYVFAVAVCDNLFVAYLSGFDRGLSAPHGFRSTQSSIELIIPPDLKIIGLVFFGRWALVEILDCYLKRNLKANGGLLDQAIFVVNTKEEEDLAFLEESLVTSPQYSKYTVLGTYQRYVGNWEAVQDPNALYLKIDDDVVFIENSIISAVVKWIFANPQYFAVSANVVNNPALSWMHHRMGVSEPYWPEMSKPEVAPASSWRASELPEYNGPIDGPPEFNINGTRPAPFHGHRWLPVRSPQGKQSDLTKFPVSTLTYDTFGPGNIKNWTAAAQIHYSFLQQLEQADTWRYKFNTWDYIYERLPINFIAIWGRDVMDVFPFPDSDDENYLTVTRPRQLNPHVVVDGTGLAVHFTYWNQYSPHEERRIT